MKLKYVVITSVDRDDLRDGGAQHFADCIREIRKLNPDIKIETLVPDFRGRIDAALDILSTEPPDVFNHNLETAPMHYRKRARVRITNGRSICSNALKNVIQMCQLSLA